MENGKPDEVNDVALGTMANEQGLQVRPKLTLLSTWNKLLSAERAPSGRASLASTPPAGSPTPTLFFSCTGPASTQTKRRRDGELNGELNGELGGDLSPASCSISGLRCDLTESGRKAKRRTLEALFSRSARPAAACLAAALARLPGNDLDERLGELLASLVEAESVVLSHPHEEEQGRPWGEAQTTAALDPMPGSRGDGSGDSVVVGEQPGRSGGTAEGRAQPSSNRVRFATFDFSVVDAPSHDDAAFPIGSPRTSERLLACLGAVLEAAGAVRTALLLDRRRGRPCGDDPLAPDRSAQAQVRLLVGALAEFSRGDRGGDVGRDMDAQALAAAQWHDRRKAAAFLSAELGSLCGLDDCGLSGGGVSGGGVSGCGGGGGSVGHEGVGAPPRRGRSSAVFARWSEQLSSLLRFELKQQLNKHAALKPGTGSLRQNAEDAAALFHRALELVAEHFGPTWGGGGGGGDGLGQGEQPQQLPAWVVPPVDELVAAATRGLAREDVAAALLPVLDALAGARGGWAFGRPARDLWPALPPDYEELVGRPMDLGTVRARLGQGLYPCAGAAVADARLCLLNAVAYNGDGSEVGRLAAGLGRLLDAELFGLYFRLAAQAAARDAARDAAAVQAAAQAAAQGAAAPSPRGSSSDGAGSTMTPAAAAATTSVAPSSQTSATATSPGDGSASSLGGEVPFDEEMPFGEMPFDGGMPFEERVAHRLADAASACSAHAFLAQCLALPAVEGAVASGQWAALEALAGHAAGGGRDGRSPRGPLSALRRGPGLNLQEGLVQDLPQDLPQGFPCPEELECFRLLRSVAGLRRRLASEGGAVAAYGQRLRRELSAAARAWGKGGGAKGGAKGGVGKGGRAAQQSAATGRGGEGSEGVYPFDAAPLAFPEVEPASAKQPRESLTRPRGLLLIHAPFVAPEAMPQPQPLAVEVPA